MEVTRNHIICLHIENESDIGVCRRKSVTLARQIGFDEIKSGEVAIMTTELVTNVIKHGGGKGKMLICQLTSDKQQKAIEIWCCDSGEGIQNLEQSVADGYTDKNSLGIGLGTIRRFSDEFEINPVTPAEFENTQLLNFKGYQHCIRTLKWVPSSKWMGNNRSLQIGAASRSKPGELLNGDTYVINHLSSTTTIAAVIDGLGHGKEAHLASNLTKEQIILKADLPLDTMMYQLHNATRGTRGTVVALLKIDTETNRLLFTGIGNIEGFLLAAEGKKNLMSFGGIIGHNMRTPRIFEFDYRPGDFVCLCSDGITSRWNSEDLNWKEHPQQNAEYIVNHFSRQNDDATVLIIRYHI